MNNKIYPVTTNWANQAYINYEEYTKMYNDSITNPDKFWAKYGKIINWIKPYSIIKNSSYTNDISIKWYEDGTLNACFNCVDRHLESRGEQTAIIWEGDNPEHSRNITYNELYKNVCSFANVLKRHNVNKGDRVVIYMPMIPEACYAMLACARIGAVHSVVFGGFSPEALAGRINDCQAKLVITADEGIRGGKRIPLKNNVDQALSNCDPNIKTIIVKCTDSQININSKKDFYLSEEILTVDNNCPIVEMNAEDPLFILYTSGSTGKPKGVLHTTGGYIVYATLTHKYVFDYQDGDVYWCTADVGWITGHSYIVYGPLSNGSTILMFEGIPTYPDASRFWQVIDKHNVNIFYTAPTAIRALMRLGNDYVNKTSRSSLKLIGTVGEPINPEAWEWYYKIVGNSKCPIVDTWWQTETGGIMMSPLPGATDLKPGSATKPFFGIQPCVIDNNGNELEGEAEGNLCIKDSWPGQMRTLFGDHDRFIKTYFSTYKGKYFAGDGCRRDKDGYYWITGRVDDVINVSGHRIGTAEVESAFVSHSKVAEAAVVGYPHEIKGQAIYAYITLINGNEPSEELRQELYQLIRKEIGAFASPEKIQFSPNLPKTRSGKIMRRILRKIATNDFEDLGDVSTLAESNVVKELIKNRKNL